MPVSTIFVKVNSKNVEALRINSALSVDEVKSALLSAAAVSSSSDSGSVLKLYNSNRALVPVGPHIPANSPTDPYELIIVKGQRKCSNGSNTMDKLVNTIKATNAVLEDFPALTKNVANLKKKVELGQASSMFKRPSNDPTSKPAMQRVARIPMDEIENLASLPRPSFSKEALEHLKHPTFDIWQWTEEELIGLMEHMFIEFDLIETFSIDTMKLRRFLNAVRYTYNKNPFHNFQHCFCVTQMMYGIVHVTGLHTKLTHLEKLTLILATIGHDLDHPGMNNAYQINASTEFAIVYNDISPLENHHAAVLFTLLKFPQLNLLSGLSDSQYKDIRKNAINCILATDMAKHGEILAKFKGYTENFNFDDANQRQLLLQIITKCSDISNEVRPKHVSEPWVDNLLEEFFGQSDKEKAEGLPTAPFMDREKVTKPGAQVGFIGFVMIPLYEMVSKVLPNMEEPVIQPIKRAHEYYKSMLEKKE
ncbi:High affinity cAMP-specific and IBMX-insensitive 3',5'-cyclic phosphodiesterase 9A [Blyttiomyces sp. JEL0837]|nr:High affinity cAMP-specific and IBMX-insensitive 3',5'-cyclic phosphodiesterase 9A [Blyttiomyces sp. JEL0837]